MRPHAPSYSVSPEPASGPAYVVRSKRLEMRCWDLSDAEPLSKAILSCADHLRPWMPWINDPHDVESVYQRLRKFRADMDLGLNVIYGVWLRQGGALVGGTGLHPRGGAGALEIGYWVHRDHVQRGYATEIAGALTRVAFEVHGVHRVDILHAPKNVNSGAVPKRLGYVFEATLRSRLTLADGSHPGASVWTMVREEYDAGAVSKLEVEALDGKGKRLM